MAQSDTTAPEIPERCCFRCKFFDKRTGFCRKSPPAVVCMQEYKTSKCVSLFPKIPMPMLDWCAKFEDEESKK